MDEVVETGRPVVHVVRDVEEADGKKSNLVLIAHEIGETHGFFVGYAGRVASCSLLSC